MKEIINDYISEKKKEAIIAFLKKHIVGEIVLALVLISFITLKLLKKQISFHLRIALVDKPEDVKGRTKTNNDSNYSDDNEPLAK